VSIDDQVDGEVGMTRSDTRKQTSICSMVSLSSSIREEGDGNGLPLGGLPLVLIRRYVPPV